jgi:hypothetical protein
MNQARVMAVVCSAAFAALLSGCGGSGSSSGTVGGTVTGLAANTAVSLTNNGGTPLAVSSNGSFTFSGSLASGDGYNVVVATQPTGQTCLITYGSGTIDFSGNSVTNVAVKCSANVPVGTMVSGLASGSQVTFALTLQNDPSNTSSVTATTNGVTNEFPVLLPLGTLYNVSVSTQPGGNVSPTQVCTANGAFSGGVVNSTPIVVNFTCK